jgi:hypothetical protein
MLRKVSYAVVILGITAGFVLAQNAANQAAGGKNQPQFGKITKVDGNKVQFEQWDPKTKEFLKARELQVAPDKVKVAQVGADNKVTPLADGLKADALTKAGKDGCFVRITLSDNTIQQIMVFANQAAWQKAMQAGAGAEK